MSDELRTAILFILDAHARSDAPEVQTAQDLAEGLGQPVAEIQCQLAILAMDDYVQLSTTHTSDNVWIKPKGVLLVEHLKKEKGVEFPRPDMGFRHTRD
jgi:hypothetical protein